MFSFGGSERGDDIDRGIPKFCREKSGLKMANLANVEANNTVGLAKRVRSVCRKLPDRKLRQLVSTQDQLREWTRIKKNALLLGKCLKARFGGGGGNPIIDIKESDEYAYRYTWAAVDYFDSLFSLIQTSFPYIDKELGKILLEWSTLLGCDQSEAGLFWRVLGEWFNSEFKRCLRPNYTASIPKLEKVYKSIRDARWEPLPETFECDEETLQQIGDPKTLAPTLYTLLAICRECNDEEVKKRLSEFYRSVCSLARVQTDAIYKARHNPEKYGRIASYRWQNNELYVGTKGGYRKAY